MLATRSGRNPWAELADHLDALGRAAKAQFAFLWATRAIGAGLALDLSALVATRFALLSLPYYWLVAPPSALLLIVLLVAGRRRTEKIRLAQQADRELGLQERLTTAVELHEFRRAGAFAALQLFDTLSHVRRHRPSRAFPLRAKRVEIATLTALGLAMVFLLLLPLPDLSPLSTPAQVQMAIKQEAERISAVAEEVGGLDSFADEADREAVAGALREASRQMENKQPSVEGALMTLADAEQKLLARQNLKVEDLRQTLARAGRALQSEVTTRDIGNALAQADASTANEALRKLGARASSLPQDRRDAAAMALAAAANAGRPGSELSESLRQASDALAANGEQIQRTLERAARDIQDATQQIATQDVLDEALAQLERSRTAISETSPSQRGERASEAGEDARRGLAAAQKSDGAGQPSQASTRGEEDVARSAQEQQGDGGTGAGEGNVEASTQIFNPRSMNSHQVHVSDGALDKPTVSDSERSAAPDEGESLVDYRDVFATYRERASAAAQDRYIPLDLKDLVESYFSSLDTSR